jgi:hypothetical protein
LGRLFRRSWVVESAWSSKRRKKVPTAQRRDYCSGFSEVSPAVHSDLQGQSVFHNAQELEEFSGSVAEIAEGDGDFLAACQTQQTDGGVPKCG